MAIACAAIWSTVFLHAARAAEKDPWSATDAADEPAYKKAIKEGVGEYDARHFEEARSLFRRAHEISPNARTFRGIGMASFELRDYVSALRNLSAALQDKRKPLSPEQRKQAQDLLDRSSLFVDVYTLTVSPRNARVIVDGRAADFELDGTLLFSFGRHTLEASAPSLAAKSLVIDVRGGERKTLSVTLQRAAAPVATRSDNRKPDLADAAAKSSTAEASQGHAAAWLWASGGAALLAGGAAALLVGENSQLDSCRRPAAGLHCTNESTIRTMWGTSLGVTIVAGAAAVTMAIVGILSWDSGTPSAKKHSAVDCTVGPFGVACAAPF